MIQVLSIVTSQTAYVVWNNSQITISYTANFYSSLMLLSSLSISLLAFESILKGNEYKYLGFMFLTFVVV
jgi:hypothetical protein